mmetsp:Transcript_43018/g.113101  ORF Transcript_43018/g.113101 Transcript_43018/m.113101 type:complete len:217 (-) Transcript_43018:21-671(-)
MGQIHPLEHPRVEVHSCHHPGAPKHHRPGLGEHSLADPVLRELAQLGPGEVRGADAGVPLPAQVVHHKSQHIIRHQHRVLRKEFRRTPIVPAADSPPGRPDLRGDQGVEQAVRGGGGDAGEHEDRGDAGAGPGGELPVQDAEEGGGHAAQGFGEDITHCHTGPQEILRVHTHHSLAQSIQRGLGHQPLLLQISVQVPYPHRSPETLGSALNPALFS